MARTQSQPIKTIQLEWEKQPRQMTFLRACGLSYPFEGGDPRPPVAKIIGYGGAAGGGKSDALLMAGIIACVTFPGCKVGYFRRKFTQLEGAGGAIDRSREFLASWCRWNGTKHRWTFPNGSILQFCHLQRPQDVHNYQSAQFDVILFDEGTQFTRDQYRYMATRNRATVSGIAPFMAIATNPGNIGHNWFKKEFVSCGEPEKVHRVEVEPGKFEDHIFIPAKLSDNQVLERRDPGYRKNLENQPEHIRKMLLEGDWDAFEGQVFSEFSRQIHVVTPFVIPKWWKRWIGHDPGYANPFAWHWFAVSPDGIVYIYREYTREESDPKVFYSDQAAKVAELSKYIDIEEGREVEKYENIDYIVAGRDAFNKSRETGKSYVDYYYEGGIPKSWGFVPANTDRKLRAATWHEYLKPFPHPEFPDRQIAKVQIFDTCTKLIETLPQLIADENDPEKVADDPSIDNCLTGETVINTVDGDFKIKDLVGYTGKVYCFDEQKQEPAIETFFNVRCTQKNVDVYEIELEDGRIIQATSDHLILTDIGWKRLIDLTIEDRIVDISDYL